MGQSGNKTNNGSKLERLFPRCRERDDNGNESTSL